jgi:restriction system protein
LSSRVAAGFATFTRTRADDLKLLSQFPEFREFRASRGGDVTAEEPAETAASPEETLDTEYQKLRKTLAAQLSEKLRQCSPMFFEHLVVELLVKMGYGGSRADAGQAVGRSGDAGIDGIIKEDRLGLDTIYIQAKRWIEGTVGRREIQQFAGALQGQRANKGIYISTSTFTKDARDYASTIGSKIVLIDGTQLAEMMIDFGLGVSTVSTYEIKKIDNDSFAE